MSISGGVALLKNIFPNGLCYLKDTACFMKGGGARGLVGVAKLHPNLVGWRWVYMQNFRSLGPVVIEIQPVFSSFFTTFLLVGVS